MLAQGLDGPQRLGKGEEDQGKPRHATKRPEANSQPAGIQVAQTA